MTQLLQRLHDELVRRQYATTTRASYLRIIQAFHRHAGGRLDRLGPDDLRRYQIYLLEERKLAVGTVIAEIAALRFFYLRVLKRRDMKEDLPYPKRRRRLPVVLSPEEVQRLIGSLTVDSSPLTTDLGWHPPLTVEQGIAKMAAWYRAQ